MSLEGIWGIYFCKLESPTDWKLMKTKRSDGILIATQKYNDVQKYSTFEEALKVAKEIINWSPRPRYDAKVVRVSQNKNGIVFVK
jgi:hypothetical protein